MFWIVRILAGIVLLVVLVYGIGLLMPAEMPVTRTTIIDARPDLVYKVAVDVDNYHLWRSDLRSLEVEQRGDLWKWTEILHSGAAVRVREVEKTSDARYAFEYENSSGVRAHWVGTFELSGEVRTRLSCTETVFVDNPFLRLPAYVLMNTGARLDVYLGDLSRRATDLGPKPKQGPIILP